MRCPACRADNPVGHRFCGSCGHLLATTGESSAAAANPIYGRTFVGRETELRQLRTAVDAATTGHGALAMVVGEPGIGKTALCEQLAAYVATRGGRALLGHCYEAGSLSLPYLPFLEALRPYVLNRDPEGLEQDLGNGAAEVARLLPEIRGRVPVELRPPGDPEEERWRLFQAMSDLLCNAATRQPLLLVLEDLHWADRGTLDLLVHVARNVQEARVLVLGTYRDVEVDLAHPLSTTLAELRRVRELPRLLLRGLSQAEVQHMVDAVAGQGVRGSLVAAVHRQTEGNPLFVQEVLRYLVEEGLPFGEERGDRPGEAVLETTIPAGAREVIGRRLARLSPACTQLLVLAAVVGREFRLDTLQIVEGLPEEAVIAGLEEATRAGVLEEQAQVGGVRYRFAHALFRQGLYEELSAPRRARVHREVAQVLEQQYGERREEHAAELAEHFAQSHDRSDLERAVRYGELAAQQAIAVFAYAEAVRLLQGALVVQGVVDPDARARRCDLLLALGEARMPLGEPRKVVDSIAPEAFALAEALGDRARASRACHMALEALHRHSTQSVGTPEFQQWVERADQYASPGTVDRAYTDIALGRVHIASRQRAEGVTLLKGALDLARTMDNPELLFTAVWQCVWNMLSPYHWREAVSLAEEFAFRSRDGVKNRTQGQVLEFCGAALLYCGDRDRAERVFRELSRVAEQTRDASNQLLGLGFEGAVAVLDGRLDDAVALGDQLVERAHLLGMPQFAQLVAPGRERAQIYSGKPVDGHRPGRPAERVLSLAHAGQHQAARESLAILWPTFQGENDTVDPLIYAADLTSLLEAAIILGDRQVAERIAPLLADSPGASVMGATACVQRLVGGAYVLLGEADKARHHYQQAIEACARMHFRPELSLCRLELAELLLDDARNPALSPAEREQQRAEAKEHLDIAVDELRTMKMAPALERALALRRKLAPRVRHTHPGGLSEREVEVLCLLAAGRSSREIGQGLVLSVRTVERHITNIYLKLDIRTRAQATAYALTHGLAAAE